MTGSNDWHPIYDFWFPPGLDTAEPETHRAMFTWWLGGGANPELPQFGSLVDAAGTGRLDHWQANPAGRLALILLLDQFPRGLFPGTARAYATDPAALRIAESGIRIGHYDALPRSWERTFFFMPLAHTEGPDHLARLDRVVAMAEAVVLTVPEPLEPLYRFSASQARAHRETIAIFGRYPHRNAALGRTSTSEELAYLERGDFVHQRRPPD